MGVDVGTGVDVATTAGPAAAATGVRVGADGCGGVGSTARPAGGPPQATVISSNQTMDALRRPLSVPGEALGIGPVLLSIRASMGP